MEKLIYTSYDGDNIHLIELFISFVLKMGHIPINPTNILGYYLSTSYYNNDKFECVKDCVSLELICDEFWIFSDTDISNLPEGVIFEFLEWNANKKGMKLKIIPIDVVRQFVQDNRIITVEDFEYTCEEVYQQLNSEKSRELKQSIFSRKQLREVLLLDLDDRHYKYADWVKLKAFKEGEVPLVTCIALPLYKLIECQVSKNRQYFYDIIKSKVIKFKKIVEFNDEIDAQSVDNFWTLKDCDVPKYIDKAWAMTKMESNENNRN